MKRRVKKKHDIFGDLFQRQTYSYVSIDLANFACIRMRKHVNRRIYFFFWNEIFDLNYFYEFFLFTVFIQDQDYSYAQRMRMRYGFLCDTFAKRNLHQLTWSLVLGLVLSNDSSETNSKLKLWDKDYYFDIILILMEYLILSSFLTRNNTQWGNIE